MFLFPSPPLLFCLGCFILSSSASPSRSSQRLCQVQGTCFACGNGHFSRFLCRSDLDCFAGEFCVPSRGFCCPLRRHQPNAECPDGSGWQRMCKKDGDCLFKDELCAEGKCCPSCKQRRVQMLREVSSAKWADRAADGLAIPQCTDDGRFHRPMQCVDGSNECYCVDKFGRNFGPMWWRETDQQQRKNNGRDQKEEATEDKDKGNSSDRKGSLNCTRLREEREQEQQRRSDEEGARDHHQKERQKAVMASRDGGTVHSDAAQTDDADDDPQSVCVDPLRVFRHCGSACPISCATRTAPRCPQEQCLRGCFCRLPYVLLDAADPFGSRCVLPAECPLLLFTPELDSWNGGFFPAASAAVEGKTVIGGTNQRRMEAEKCADARKNFQTCGSACPAGCGKEQPQGEGDGCSEQCVAGCFCRVPFVLLDPLNLNSECVLPRHCPPPPLLPSSSSLLSPLQSSQNAIQICSFAQNRSRTSCFSRKCARSCADHLAQHSSQCFPDDCVPGCECSPPMVVLDKSASIWQCVLPEDCPKLAMDSENGNGQQRRNWANCDDPRKEFLACGSSCPLACDRLDQPVKTCSPCVSGCFCRNGFVFTNASDWRQSSCVPVSECPSALSRLSTKMIDFQQQQSVDHQAFPSNYCPSNSVDTNGPFCENDADCGVERKCCLFPSPPLTDHSTWLLAPAVLRNHCICADPNSIWTECGSLCPDFCGQTVPRLCPGPCRPGCYCPPGYVKRMDDLASECVPIERCDGSSPIMANSHQQQQHASTSLDLASEIKGDEQTCGEALASATLYGRNGEYLGRLVVKPEGRMATAKGAKRQRIRLSGQFVVDGNLTNGEQELLLSIHQFTSTTTDGCVGVGEPLVLTVEEEEEEKPKNKDGFNRIRTTAKQLRARRAKNGDEERTMFGMEARLVWPEPIEPGTNPLIGHSVLLNRTTGGGGVNTLLGCAVLGIAPSC